MGHNTLLIKKNKIAWDTYEGTKSIISKVVPWPSHLSILWFHHLYMASTITMLCSLNAHYYFFFQQLFNSLPHSSCQQETAKTLLFFSNLQLILLPLKHKQRKMMESINIHERTYRIQPIPIPQQGRRGSLTGLPSTTA